MSNPNFDLIASTTIDNYRPKLVDNIFSARPLWFALSKAGRVKHHQGGRKIVIPIMSGVNGTAGSFATTDTISTTAQTGVTAAEFDWKQYAVSITVNGLELAQNSGDEQVVDLMGAKVLQAEESLIEILDEDLVAGDGSGNSSKDIEGLDSLVNQNAAAIGGIAPQTYSWWEAYIESSAGALTIADMSTAYNTVSVGNDQPDLILTTQTLYEKYETLLQPQLRYEDSSMADAGFQNLQYKGAPVAYDSYTETGKVFFLNTNYLGIEGHKENWFRTTPFVKPTNQDIKVAQIITYLNAVCSNRSRQGVLTGRTA